MDTLETVFRVTREVKRGLNSGELIRHGGVIRRKTGELYCFLREVGAGDSPSDVASQMRRLVEFLSTSSGDACVSAPAGALASPLLSLGAVPVATAVICRKLEQLTEKVDRLEVALDSLTDLQREHLTSFRNYVHAQLLTAFQLLQNAPLSASPNECLREAQHRLMDARHHLDRELLDHGAAWAEGQPALLFETIDALALTCAAEVYAHCQLNEAALASKRAAENHELFRARLREVESMAADERFRLAQERQAFVIGRNLVRFQETEARLGSLAEEMRFVEQHQIPYQDWAALGSGEQDCEFALIFPPSTRDCEVQEFEGQNVVSNRAEGQT